MFSHLIAALNGGPIMANDDGDVDVLQGASGDDQFYYHFAGGPVLDVLHGKGGIRHNT